MERHNNDLNKVRITAREVLIEKQYFIQAELWLKEQAQVLGWAKATKLEGRHTSQGLVAVAVNGYNGALVEVNCETDFVARNTEFIKIVQEAAQSCLNYTKQQVQPVVSLYYCQFFSYMVDITRYSRFCLSQNQKYIF